MDIPQFSQKLEDEISYIINNFGQPSEENDFETFTRYDAVRRLMDDMDDEQMIAHEFQKELRLFGIQIGMYRIITKDEMDRTTIMGRSQKKYEFKQKGVCYIFDSWKPLEELEEKEEKT